MYPYILVSVYKFQISYFHSHPGFFGKVGMRHYHKTLNKYHCPIVNLDRLWSLVTEQTREAYKAKPDGPAPVIDCVRAVSIYTNLSSLRHCIHR